MRKFFLDPGHGGRDPGAVAHGIQEKDVVLEICLRIREILASEYSNQVAVQMSRTKDEFISLSQRASMANNWGADFFCSVHINAGGGDGYEGWIHESVSDSSNTTSFASVMGEEIIKATGFNDRGVKRGRFTVLGRTSMSAILTENGFIDTKSNADLLKDSSFIDKIARGHVNGFARIFNLEGSGGAAEPSKPSSKPSRSNKRNSARHGGDPVIHAIQQFINSYDGVNIRVDGIAGPETMRGLIMVLQIELNRQFGRNLKVDGIFGPRTRASLVNVRRGARGNLTRVLQAFLYIRGV